MSTVRMAGVEKSFGARRVLDGVEFAVDAGEFVAIIGPSGCGKSTVFNLLAGLEVPDRGAITVRGDSPVSSSHCAYMPQKDLLFPWRSVLDNTALGLEVAGVPRAQARARAAALFPTFGLAGFESARPSQLSGGMRQRAALLRTVVQGRDVLLLDEPFGALDSLTRTEMQTWLQDVRARYGWTVLMITHDIREAVFLADRVVVLSARPARVCRQVEVKLPRPRTLSMVTTPAFGGVEHQLIEVLHEQSRRARAGEELAHGEAHRS